MNDIKPRVLVVDDEPQIRRFLRISLSSQNYKVDEAETVRQLCGLPMR
jgi:two-component system KDP operon response regulator KdpE